MSKRLLLLDALEKKYEGQRAEALATLEVYLSDSVGIGEHPQVVEEMSKQMENLAAAEDVLGSLRRNYKALKQDAI
tara:strand:+ start:907 stop:1134 length:228 start_codon:yes stop_codon:yes gene_type:complete